MDLLAATGVEDLL